MLDLVYGHSLLFTAAAVVGACVGVSLAGQWLIHRLVPLPHRRRHNDVIGFCAGTGALIYVVLLAFIASTVWIAYDRADSLVNQEASLAGDLFRDTSLLPKSFEDSASLSLRDYVQAIIREEWPNMARGERPGRQGWPLLRNFHDELGRVSVVTPVQVAVVQEMLTRLNQLYDVRRERFRISSRPSLDPVIWFVVLVGGLITIAFNWLFGFEMGGLHWASTAMIAATLGLIIFLIVVFNYPFRGQMQISAAPFEQTLKNMERRLTAPEQPDR